jgi:rubrerythrin
MQTPRIDRVQRRVVDAIKRNAASIALHSPRANQRVVTEYLWTEEGAEAAALRHAASDSNSPEWLQKMLKNHQRDEQRHAQMFRTYLATQGVTTPASPPRWVGAKLWWLQLACQPYQQAFHAGNVVVALAVAAQFEVTGVRIFERHLEVLRARAPLSPLTDLLTTIVADEKHHAKSCATAVQRLTLPHEHQVLKELQKAVASIDRSFGISLSTMHWLHIAALRIHDTIKSAVRYA